MLAYVQGIQPQAKNPHFKEKRFQEKTQSLEVCSMLAHN